MLKSLGEFCPYGRRHTALHPHLINDASEIQEVDFNLFSKGASSVNRQKTSSYNLYAVDGRPLKYINELSGDMVEQTSHRDRRKLPNGAMDLEEELYVDGSTVIWSRGGHIVKSFKFELERQPVELALFAWFRFKISYDGESDEKSTAMGRWHEDVYYDDGRIQGNEHSSNMMDISSKKRRHPDAIYENSSSSSSNINSSNKRRDTARSNTELRKALCIILRDSVKIYFEDGLMYSVHLNFPVQRAYALHVGLILERKRADMIDDANAAFLQPFVCITDPMGECELVTMTDDGNRSFSLDFRKDMMGVPVDHELVFATSVDYSRGDPEKQQLIVTYNAKKHAHFVWMLTDEEERLKQPKIKRKPPPQSAASFPSLKNRKKSKSKRVKHNNMPSPIATTPPPLTRKDSLAQFHEDFSSDTDQLYGSEAGDSFHESDDAGHFLHLLYETNPTKGDRRKHARDTVFLAHDNDGMDLLCIMRNREQTVLILSINKLLARDMDVLLKKISARSAVSITSRNGTRHILLLRTGNRIQFVVEPRKEILVDVILPSTLSEKIKELSDAVATSFNVHMADGRIERYRADVLPYSGIVQDGVAALSCILSSFTHALFRKRFIEHLYSTLPSSNSIPRMTCEWISFIIALLSFVSIDNSNIITATATLLDKVSESSFPSWLSLVDSSTKLRQSYAGEHIALDLEAVLRSLHMLHEDYRLSQIKSRSLLPKLNPLMILLSALSGNREWVAHYTKDTAVSFSQVLSDLSHVKGKKIVAPPTDIIGTIRYYSPIPPHRLSLEDVFGIPRIDPVLGLRWNAFGHTIDMTWLLYRMLRAEEYERMVDRMVEEEIKRYEIEDLHPIIGEPLIAALDLLRENPPMTWTTEHYNLIGRQDMVNQLLESKSVIDPNGDHFRLDTIQPFKTNMHDLCKSITMAPPSRSTTTTPHAYDTLDVHTEKLRFGYEGILETVRSSLDITRTPELTVPDRPDLSDADITAEHQTHVMNLLQRTAALSVGRGIYGFGTYMPDLTKDFPIRSINLSAKLLPLRTIVTADDRHWAPEYFDWPRFHNGVAAGLQISPSCRVGGSWIDFCNREEELRPEHGGFLLALGLNGNLRDLPLISWYRYMTQPCELATTGFVLGLAAAYRGTKNSKVTKLLAVHVPALLPSGSTTLNHSIAIQSTSLVSLGLVFMGSCDRLMSSVMVAEIERYADANPSTLEANFEGCALAAGFALGFVTLGRGDESAGLFDLHLKDKLSRLMLGQTALSTTTTGTREQPTTAHGKYTTTASSSSHHHDNGYKSSRDKLSEPAAKPINLDVTSPGATIALGLMYMRTNNIRVAESIDVLMTRPYLNYIRPDLLMLRIVARNLIMWNSIQPTNEWIDSHIPEFIKHDVNQENTTRSSQLIEASKQAMYNIVSGACLSLALRFAGSDNKQAFQCLLRRLDSLMRISNMTAVGFQENITRSVVRSCVGVVATAAAMVVAGTGNLDLLSRLKTLHGRVGPHTRYGDHMAAHMAMGLLFAGLGGYTLSSSMEATAGLLCAFYPFYPISPDDNRYYLQAFRHLWVMSMDVRWLMPLDVDTGKPCRVPLLVNVQQDEPWLPEQVTREMRIFAPSVLPSYTLVKSIRLDSSRYYPLCLKLDGGPYQKAVTNSGMLYIQRRPGCKTHDECPEDNIPLDGVMSLKVD